MDKVYTGTIPISEHIKKLDMSNWMPHEDRKQAKSFDKPKRKQSIQIRKLKREAGLE